MFKLLRHFFSISKISVGLYVFVQDLYIQKMGLNAFPLVKLVKKCFIMNIQTFYYKLAGVSYFLYLQLNT